MGDGLYSDEAAVAVKALGRALSRSCVASRAVYEEALGEIRALDERLSHLSEFAAGESARADRAALDAERARTDSNLEGFADGYRRGTARGADHARR